MRVLHVIQSLDPDMGGLPKTAAALPAALAGAGAEAGLLHYSNPAQEERIQAAYGAFPGFATVRRLAILDPAPAEWAFNRQAIRLAAEFKPDVIHTHGIWEPLLRNVHAWARRAGVPYVILPQSMLHPWQNQNRRLAKAILKGPLGWRALWRQAGCWQALTGEERGHLLTQGVAARVEIIPNGIFPGELEPAPPAGAFHRRFPALGGRPYLLSLARLHPQKSPDVLLEAFALAAERLPGHALVLAGPDYGMRAALERRVTELGLGDRVLLPGSLGGDAKREALHGAALFCLPSQAEGFSLALVEAGACGLPLVISPGCLFDELVQAGAAVCSEVRVAPLADALVAVAADPARAAAMGAAARALVASRYTWPSLAERLLALYRSLLPNGKTTP